jgi:hypothetical protein
MKKLAELLDKWVLICAFRFLSLVRREITDPIVAQPIHISDIDPKFDSLRWISSEKSRRFRLV